MARGEDSGGASGERPAAESGGGAVDEPHPAEDAADHQVQSLRGYELEPGGGKARKKSLCRGNSEGI